jgi:hypothetical protein
MIGCPETGDPQFSVHSTDQARGKKIPIPLSGGARAEMDECREGTTKGLAGRAKGKE